MGGEEERGGGDSGSNESQRFRLFIASNGRTRERGVHANAPGHADATRGGAKRFDQNRQKMQNRRWGADGNRPRIRGWGAVRGEETGGADSAESLGKGEKGPGGRRKGEEKDDAGSFYAAIESLARGAGAGLIAAIVGCLIGGR